MHLPTLPRQWIVSQLTANRCERTTTQRTSPEDGRVVLVVARVHVDAVLEKQFDELPVPVQGRQVDAGQVPRSLALQLGQHSRLEQLGPSSGTRQSIQKHLRQRAVALLRQYVQARLGRFDSSN